MDMWGDVVFGLSTELWVTLAVILLGVYLFVREPFSIDVTSIIIMTLFIITGVLAPEEGFAGFTNRATITVACMFVLSYGLFRSGVLDPLIRLLVRLGRKNSLLALGVLMLFSTVLSAFLNVTAVVALLIPGAMRIAEHTKIDPGRLLMPLSFAALLGGICTLIGTSTNILVSGIVEQNDLPPLGMFEFSGAAIWLTLVGLVYMLTVGRWLLPEREPAIGTSDVDMTFVTLVRVAIGSRDIGTRLSSTRLCQAHHAEVLEVQRQGSLIPLDMASDPLLEPDDVLKVAIKRASLLEVRREKDFEIATERDTSKSGPSVRVFKAALPKGSRLIGRTLRDADLRRSFDRGVLGLRLVDREPRTRLVDQPLDAGDILLFAADQRKVYRLLNEEAISIIDEYEAEHVDRRKALLAIGTLIAVVSIAALGLAPIMITAVVGVLALLITRVLTPEEAYEAVEWKVIFLLAGVLSMGAALERSGGDEFIANALHDFLGARSPAVVLGSVFILTSLLTNVMSNNATAALMTPIVLKLAPALQVSERPFIIAVMLAASVAFMTPIGYQTNSMVYAPGNYRFVDYLRVGVPLNVLMWIVATYAIPRYFPF